jgi:hypothetical protein
MLVAILVIDRHDVEAKSERKSWTAGGEGVTGVGAIPATRQEGFTCREHHCRAVKLLELTGDTGGAPLDPEVFYKRRASPVTAATSV